MRCLIVAITALAIQAAEPRFDVASIKPSPDVLARAVNPIVARTFPGGIWRSRDTTLDALIRAVYPGHQSTMQVAGGPDWVRNDFYDIEARADAATAPATFQRMARALLADRFKLAIHTEMRDSRALVLSTRQDGRLGSGLTKPAVDCTAFRAGGERPVDPTRQRNADRIACAWVAMPVSPRTRVVAGANWRISGGDVTIGTLLTLLTNYMGRPVVDRTGLTQRFDVELQFAVDDPSDPVDGPRLREAIAEQLGLQVKDGRTQIDVLVIDHIERPSPN